MFKVMEFIIMFQTILVIIGIIATVRLNQIRKQSKSRITFSVISSLADCVELGIIVFLLINVGEYFNHGLISLINRFWYVYILIILLVVLYLFYHFYRLPFIEKVGDIINDEVILDKKELANARIEIAEYQTLASQRVNILACMAPLGILLPFMGDIFKISHVTQVGLGSIVSLITFFVYCLFLWHNYKTFVSATKLLSAIDKQVD